MVPVLFYGSIFGLIIVILVKLSRRRHMVSYVVMGVCVQCGKSYAQWKDPRGQICPHCGKSVVRHASESAVDTSRLQDWSTCGCDGVKEGRSELLPSMLLCGECLEDEAIFTKPLQK